jgi:hypothetical protein
MKLIWKQEWPTEPGYYWIWHPGDKQVFMTIHPENSRRKLGKPTDYYAKIDRPAAPSEAELNLNQERNQ